MRTATLLLLALAVGCQGGDDPATDDTSDDPTDSTDSATEDTATTDTSTTDTGADLCDDAPVVTWENFGAGFVTENCQACHASTSPERLGAPPDVVFDSEDDVFERVSGILRRVVDQGDMPPQGGISEDDRYLTEVWLSCN